MMNSILITAIGGMLCSLNLCHVDTTNKRELNVEICDALESGIISQIVDKNEILNVYLSVPESKDDGSFGWILSYSRDAFVYIGKIKGKDLKEMNRLIPGRIYQGETLDYWLPIYLKTEKGTIIEFTICPVQEWGINNYYPAYNLWNKLWNLLNQKLDIDRRVAYDCSQSANNRLPSNYHKKTKKIAQKDIIKKL